MEMVSHEEYMAEQIEKLIQAGFFDFESAESMLTSQMFPALRAINLYDISDVLFSLNFRIEEIERESRKFFWNRKKGIATVSQLSSLKTMRNRIIVTQKAIAFWINKQKVLKFLPNERKYD